MSRLLPLGVLLLGWVVVAIAADGDADEQLAAEEKVLKDAGVAADGPGLLEFFRKRTLRDEARVRITALLRQLGDDSFTVREQATKALIAVGPSAVPALQQATLDSDVEVSSRAKQCLQALGPAGGWEVLAAAARVLAHRKPPGTVATLLAYLPSAADAHLEEEIAVVLCEVGVVNGTPDPALATAVEDKQAARRLAAAMALSRASGDDHRTAVRKLLGDLDPRVRLHSASGLVTARDKAAVPTLITLLGEGPTALLWPAEDLLCRIAGDQAPQVNFDPTNAASRQKYREVWENWWKANEDKIDLSKMTQAERLLGLTVIADFDGGTGGMGKVWECGADGKERWKIDGLQGPADIQVLPAGRILIAEHSGGRVTERTRDGRVVWEQRVNGNPVSCQRLANGNTFIATYTEVLEVTREGKTVYSYEKTRNIFSGQKLRNGNLLFINSQRQIQEITAAGKDVRTVPAGDTTSWASVQLLPSGHFLVAQYNASKVVEIDEMGKKFLDVNVPQTTFAMRLSNGHTLATDTQNRRVVEFDQSGKEVWSQTTTGRPFCVRRR